ncbi:MAG: lipoate--protein ligase family protein [Deltaproteobacteria bacterium]|nr:lipoate--protein ligase family protein [Deltaproteobacteria bacterium]
MEQLRLIKTEFTYADFSTSVSPAVELALEEREAHSAVVLNIFRGGSFTSGVLDDPEKALDLEYCRKEQIVVRRRQNGGGAIYGPDGGVFIVLYLDTRLSWVPVKTVEEAFRVVLNALAETINELFGVAAVYRPVNDIEVEGRKLIPTSARLEKDILTMRLLVNVVPTDPNILKNAIITPPEKIQDKKIKDPGARFTCLENETGRKISPSELEALAAKTVKKIFGNNLQLISAEPSELEKKYAAEYQRKYTSDEWFYANSEHVRFKKMPSKAVKSEGRHKAPAGLIRVTLLTLNHLMHDLIITGDFHPSPSSVLKDMEDVLRGKPCTLNVVENEIKKILGRSDVEIAGTTVKDFLGAFSIAFEKAGM